MNRRLRIGFVTSPAEKLRDYYPTLAEPDFVPTEPPFTPDDQLAVDELRRAGHSVNAVVWGSDVGPLREHLDLLVIRSPWDYMDTEELRRRFWKWIGELDRCHLPVENHPRVMAWLMDKRYMKDFEAAGVPIVPTQVLATGETLALVERFDAWGPLIVKPSLSAAGVGLVFVEARQQAIDFQNDFDERCRRESYLVQPFVPEIRTAGEWSLIYLGGEYSHAVHKLPGAGKILVHAEQGGSVGFATPPTSVRAAGDLVATRVAVAMSQRHGIREIPLPPLYLRIDIIEAASGPLLSECEGVEPELFFRARPESAARFRDLLECRL
ncbi:MAG: RimK family alpha-L-glutamate ligase [Gemmataceae bacterium]